MTLARLSHVSGLAAAVMGLRQFPGERESPHRLLADLLQEIREEGEDVPIAVRVAAEKAATHWREWVPR